MHYLIIILLLFLDNVVLYGLVLTRSQVDSHPWLIYHNSVIFFLNYQKGAKKNFITDLGKSYGMVARWYEEVIPHCGEFYCGKKVVR